MLLRLLMLCHVMGTTKWDYLVGTRIIDVLSWAQIGYPEHELHVLHCVWRRNLLTIYSQQSCETTSCIPLERG